MGQTHVTNLPLPRQKTKDFRTRKTVYINLETNAQQLTDPREESDSAPVDTGPSPAEVEAERERQRILAEEKEAERLALLGPQTTEQWEKEQLKEAAWRRDMTDAAVQRVHDLIYPSLEENKACKVRRPPHFAPLDPSTPEGSPQEPSVLAQACSS